MSETSSDTRTLPEVIRAHVDIRLEQMHTAMPGRVVTYDRQRKRASVQPLLKALRRDTGEMLTLPIVSDVPVVFPGAGTYSITFPVAAGDLVLLVFAEASLDRWLASSGGNVIDPGSLRRSHLTDAIAIPGLRTFTPVDDSAEDALVINAPAGAEVRIGSREADDPVVRRSDLSAALSSLDARLVGHSHASLGGPGTVTLDPIPTPVPACSPNVKVD